MYCTFGGCKEWRQQILSHDCLKNGFILEKQSQSPSRNSPKQHFLALMLPESLNCDGCVEVRWYKWCWVTLLLCKFWNTVEFFLCRLTTNVYFGRFTLNTDFRFRLLSMFVLLSWFLKLLMVISMSCESRGLWGGQTAQWQPSKKNELAERRLMQATWWTQTNQPIREKRVEDLCSSTSGHCC